MYRSRAKCDKQHPTRQIAPRRPAAEDQASDRYPPIGATDLPLDIVLSRLHNVRGYGSQYSASCPAHHDCRPSMSITEIADGSLLIHCHAGCTTEEIMEAIDLDLTNLFPSSYALRYGQGKRRGVQAEPSHRFGGTAIEPEVDPTPYKEILGQARKAERRDLMRLARQLGLPVESLDALRVGYLDDRFVIPERDDRRRLVGIAYRYLDGKKTCEPGSHRGLIIPLDGSTASGPIYLVEGATDTAALHAVGVMSIGRPAARASGLIRLWLGRLLRRHAERDVIVVADRDPARDGRSTGIDGARELAEYLGSELGRDVAWALPRRPYKDVRDQVVAGKWTRGLVMKEVR